jgi:hypothetical protein
MARLFQSWVLPGMLFTIGFGFAACSGDAPDATDDCVPAATTTTSGGGGADAGSNELPPGGDGEPETGMDGNNFHHPMDPTQPGQQDPFEILKNRVAEGPPEIRSRLHSCSKMSYAALGDLLASRGVDITKVAAPMTPPTTAGEIYNDPATRDALGAANFDARQGEAYFYTISAATKLFDIFVQAAPEIIQNIKTTEACQGIAKGYPVFDEVTGACVYYGLSCLMGRPATDDDMALCNLMVAQATPGNIANKRAITVAAFLAAAHTCE